MQPPNTVQLHSHNRDGGHGEQAQHDGRRIPPTGAKTRVVRLERHVMPVPQLMHHGRIAGRPVSDDQVRGEDTDRVLEPRFRACPIQAALEFLAAHTGAANVVRAGDSPRRLQHVRVTSYTFPSHVACPLVLMMSNTVGKAVMFTVRLVFVMPKLGRTVAVRRHWRWGVGWPWSSLAREQLFIFSVLQRHGTQK